MSCRMYDTRPAYIEPLCYLCAHRGGCEDCPRSADPYVMAEGKRRYEKCLPPRHLITDLALAKWRRLRAASRQPLHSEALHKTLAKAAALKPREVPLSPLLRSVLYGEEAWYLAADGYRFVMLGDAVVNVELARSVGLRFDAA